MKTAIMKWALGVLTLLPCIGWCLPTIEDLRISFESREGTTIVTSMIEGIFQTGGYTFPLAPFVSIDRQDIFIDVFALAPREAAPAIITPFSLVAEIGNLAIGTFEAYAILYVDGAPSDAVVRQFSIPRESEVPEPAPWILSALPLAWMLWRAKQSARSGNRIPNLGTPLPAAAASSSKRVAYSPAPKVMATHGISWFARIAPQHPSRSTR